MQVHNSSPVGIPAMTVHAVGLERGEETSRGTDAGEIFAVDLKLPQCVYPNKSNPSEGLKLLTQLPEYTTT